MTLTAIGVPAIVSIVAIRSGRKQAKEGSDAQDRRAEKEREHQRLLAQEARAQERRGQMYEELLTAVRRITTRVEGTKPIFSTDADPEPPPPLPEEEIFVLEAKVQAFGSDEAHTLLNAWSDKVRDFWQEAQDLADMYVDRGVLSATDWNQKWDKTPSEQWRALQAAREAVRDAEDALQKRVRQELR